MAIEIPFSNKLGESFSAQAGRETLVNMFAEADEGRSQIIRRQRPGLTLVESGAAGIPRGIEKLQGSWWVVYGTTFAQWDGTTLTSRGTLNTNTGPVTMATNNAEEIAVCDGLDLWSWDGSNFTQVTEDGWTPKGIESLGGYGIVHDAIEKGRFYTTALNDFTDVDSLDFANAEAKPDDVVRIIYNRGEMWMFGETTTEVFRLSGTAFPLAKVSASEMQRGCAAQFSVASDDNALFWLGDDYRVYRANGYSPERVSTHAVERRIADVPNKEDAQAFFIQVDGNKFYTLRFPGELTLQLNTATGLWNECSTFQYPDWQVVGSAGQSTEYVLTTAGICRLDTDVNKDVTTTMRRVCVSPPVYDLGKRFTVWDFMLDCEVGRTTGTEPKVMLEVSRDGEMFGNILTRAMGATGKYTRRVIWRKLGTAREMTFRISMTDDAPFKIMGSTGNITGSNG